MTVIDEILSSLQEDAPIRELRLCVRAAAVWSRRLGLAYSFPRTRCDHDDDERPRARKLAQMSARRVADLARSEILLDAALGMAAINSLLDPQPDLFVAGNAYDLIASRGRGQNVTVVGYFPFLKRLREEVGKLWVLELDPREGCLPVSEAANVIPRSRVVVITGSTLINHTFDDLMELARGRYVIVLGPSTPLTPVLFDAGVSAVCGSLVDDPQTALRCVSEGLSFRATEGLRPIIMSSDRR